MQALQNQLDYAFQLVSKPDNASIKQGQIHLNKLKSNIEYPLLLLAYMKDSIAYESKLRGAIQLRIWCDKYKNMEQFQRSPYKTIIGAIQINILFAFMTFTDKVEKTLLPGIVALTAVQFPDNWKDLIPTLITYSQQNPNATLKTLQLMSEITHKYSYLSRSDILYHEIIIVCNQFHAFLLKLTRYSIDNILMNQDKPDHIKILEQEMILFYNLNYQDIHPNFQDNLPEWMNILNKVMQLPDLNQKFFKCKGAALQSILLYANKYKDDVQESIKGFMEQIWKLCANASADSQYDDIVTNALKYFKNLLSWQDMKQSFASNIDNLISNLILPNLNLTQSYKDMYQQDIQTFISYFFRNAETMTRRSNAIQLLQSIVRMFNANFQNFLDTQVRGFQPNPSNINMQCLLLTLVIQSAPKGFRDVDGVTSLQYNQNIIAFCYEQFIKSTLNSIYSKISSSSSKPIQKQLPIMQLLTALRFIYYFRIYIPTSDLNLILKLCCTMPVENQSLRQIIILVVSAIVTIKHGDFMLYQKIVWYYQPDKMEEVAPDVFGMIAVYEKQTQQLNAGLNRLFFSVIKQLKNRNQKFYDAFSGPIIKSMLCKTSTFTFSSVLPLFQAIGYLAYNLASIKSSKSGDLQTLTQSYFHQMIKMQSDMLNFCFQVLSIFLRYNPGNLQFYTSIYSSIIRPQNWTFENLSLISSYLQYISSYLNLQPQKIIDNKQIFQQILTKLIELQHYELFYRLLRCILKLTNLQGFHQYGYMDVLVRGTAFIAEKGIQGRKMGLLFLFQVMYDYDVGLAIKGLNSIQNGFVQSYLLSSQDIIRTMQVLRNRKLMFGAICNALAIRSFSSVQNQATVLSLLIQNTTNRFKRDAYMSTIPNQNTLKKQSTYQKLAVFKQIDSDNPSQQRTAISLDEDLVLLQTYNICANNNPAFNNYINEKNMERIKKIYEKNQNSNNNL